MAILCFSSIPMATELPHSNSWWLSALLKGLSVAGVEQIESFYAFIQNHMWEFVLYLWVLLLSKL